MCIYWRYVINYIDTIACIFYIDPLPHSPIMMRMITTHQQDQRYGRLLGYWLGSYLLLWGILSGFVYHSIFPDTAENLTLSHALSWSYSKHPPLGMLVIRQFSMLLHDNRFAAFLAGVSCLVVALYFIYRISLRYLTAQQAVCATIISSLSYYCLVNFVLEYNQNTIMLPFWVASIYYLLLAMEHNKLRDWLVLSVICFLGVMAKYETLMIMGIEFVYLLLNFNKKYLRGLSVAALLFLVLLIPHVIWLWHYHFYPIQFVWASSSTGRIHHLSVLLSAVIVQPLNYMLAFIVILVLVRSHQTTATVRPRLNFNHPLLFFALMPWLLFCVLAIFINVKAEWGYPMLVLLVPALFYCFNLSGQYTRLTIKVVTGLQLLIFGIFFLTNSDSSATHRVEWPSAQLAREAQNYWLQHHATLNNLKYIGGDEFLVFYLGAYLPQKPLLLKDYSFQKSPWIKRADFAKQGALFIQKGCTDAVAQYQHMGFKVADHQCFVSYQTHTLQRQQLAYTLYIIQGGKTKVS